MRHHISPAVYRSARRSLVMLATIIAIGSAAARPALGQAAAAGQGGAIDVKFRADTIRLRDGVPVDIDASSATNAVVAAQLRPFGTWERLHSVDDAALALLRDRAVRLSGKAVPDLSLYFRVVPPAGSDLERLARDLEQLPNIEAATVAPIAAPLPVVPDYFSPTASPTSYQRYLDAAPDGIGTRGLAANGAGVRICDVEYSWNRNHSDLPALTLRGGAIDDPFVNNNHGTAVLGVLGSLANGSGTNGIASGAALSIAAASTTTGGYNIAASIIACVASLAPGDVIIIEQQIYGPNHIVGNNDCGGCVPVEWYKPTYDAIVLAVAGEIVVVEAGANGNENLDAAVYATGNSGHHPFLAANDSGAIIVGAGRSPRFAGPVRSRHDFSNYGSTVDLQGWGDNVTTTGYGSLYNIEGANSYYTSTFNGTSSASPVVAGAAALLQEVYEQRFGAPATPATVLRLLRDSGTPQNGADHIGPLPNVPCAIDSALPLQITGVSSVAIGSSTAISATLAAPFASSVTRPLTYTWQVDASVPITVTGVISSVIAPAWTTIGPHTVRASARLGCGVAVERSLTLDVRGVAPTAATLGGAQRLLLGSTAAYTATVTPLGVTAPVTYTWRVGGQPPAVHVAGASDALAVTWGVSGTQTLTATIANGWGAPLVVTRTVTIDPPTIDAALAGPLTPVLRQTSRYTATLETMVPTLPVSYTWQIDSQPPIIRAGSRSDSLALVWSSAGPHTVTVTVRSGLSAPREVRRAVTVGQRSYPLYLPRVTG